MDDQCSAYCVFDYMYRDAANWKTFSQVLLAGQFRSIDVDKIWKALGSDGFLVAEQIGIPALQSEHIDLHGATEEEDLDHAFHQFIALHPAEPGDLSQLKAVGDVVVVVARIQASADRWDCALSPFGRF